MEILDGIAAFALEWFLWWMTWHARGWFLERPTRR